ncbi:hypothetical protein ACLOJK_002273 [Asimina triloba]
MCGVGGEPCEYGAENPLGILIREAETDRFRRILSSPPPAMSRESDAPDETVLLHGDLDLRIIEARRLPNMDMLTEHLRRCFVPCHTALDAARNSRLQKHQPHHRRRKIITSDPYVKVCLSGATVARTRIFPNSQDPVWDESFSVALAHPARWIEFRVKDNDVFGAQLIGVAKIPAADVQKGERIEGWFPVIGSSGAPPKPETAIHVSLQFTPVEENTLYKQGIARDPAQMGVRGTYFPRRKGGLLRLYQDAHVPDGMLPEIALEQGEVFQHEKCWEDICHAILEAHHLIYIVGWSVYHKVKLVREPTKQLAQDLREMTLGDLLKYKSQEGVRVCLLVWDDKTSHDKFMISTDEHTVLSGPHLKLCPSVGFGPLEVARSQSTLWTRLTARKRSSGLCINSVPVVDFLYLRSEVELLLFWVHNAWSQCNLICKAAKAYKSRDDNLEGVMQTHDEETRKFFKHSSVICVLSPRYGSSKLSIVKQRARTLFTHHQKCVLVDTQAYGNYRKITAFVGGLDLCDGRYDTPEHRLYRDLDTVFQYDYHNPTFPIFRSIDSGSLTGFQKIPREAVTQNLVCEKNVLVFLIGFLAVAGADNLVPMELALKIASKIRANEKFAVYVVIPLWPEGIPSSAAVQEILFWQNRTMQMMYDIVAKELKSMGLKSHPREYLNFYCLGNREECPQEMNCSTSQRSQNADALGGAHCYDKLVIKFCNPAHFSPAASKKKISRFMIYVHAKGMIVDDEYVLLGSANINQRSLDGSRDTEIAMGAYQPHYTWNENRGKHPHGQVYGYRMSLWTEHLGTLDERFKEPQREDCVMAVNEIADENWKRFAADEFMALQGHLLRYPVEVETDGKVCPLPNCENFPDFGGKICGADTNLPNALTT